MHKIDVVLVVSGFFCVSREIENSKLLLLYGMMNVIKWQGRIECMKANLNQIQGSCSE